MTVLTATRNNNYELTEHCNDKFSSTAKRFLAQKGMQTFLPISLNRGSGLSRIKLTKFLLPGLIG
jgi:hypothetical protein